MRRSVLWRDLFSMSSHFSHKAKLDDSQFLAYSANQTENMSVISFTVVGMHERRNLFGIQTVYQRIIVCIDPRSIAAEKIAPEILEKIS
jgi:hypothetical protein